MKSRKICLLGDFSVGKTSAVSRFMRSTFNEVYLTTVGVKIDTKTMASADGDVRLVVWDIAGSSRMGQARLNYLRGAHGFVLVGDGTHRQSIAVALELWRQANSVLCVETPAVLLVNKSDLADEWDVPPHVLESLRRSLPVFCTSARTGAGIEQAFAAIAEATTATVGA